jgi:hypothetical protein
MSKMARAKVPDARIGHLSALGFDGAGSLDVHIGAVKHERCWYESYCTPQRLEREFGCKLASTEDQHAPR